MRPVRYLPTFPELTREALAALAGAVFVGVMVAAFPTIRRLVRGDQPPEPMP